MHTGPEHARGVAAASAHEDVLQRMGRLTGVLPNVRLFEHLDCLDMVQMEKYAAAIATDSGVLKRSPL